MRTAAFLLLVLTLSSFAFAAKLEVIDPVQSTLQEGSTLDLGMVGPGQKVVVMAARRTGEISKNAVGQQEALWDRLLADSLPKGWVSEPSKFYENPFQAFVTVSPDALDGDYYFKLSTMDEYDGIPSLALNAKVRVSKDVLGFAVQNKDVRVGVDQPAVFFLTLQNTGSAADVFELTISGLPSALSANRRIFVPHNSVVNVAYEIVPKEQGDYKVVFRAQSLSSKKVFKEETATLKTVTSVWNDMRASANGVLLFPSIQQTLYSLWAFAGNLFG